MAFAETPTVTDDRYTLGSSAVAPTTEREALVWAINSMGTVETKAELARRANYKLGVKMDLEAHSRLSRVQQIAAAARAEIRALMVEAGV